MSSCKFESVLLVRAIGIWNLNDIITNKFSVPYTIPSAREATLLDETFEASQQDSYDSRRFQGMVDSRSGVCQHLKL